MPGKQRAGKCNLHKVIEEALNNSSMNSQSTKWIKCDFIHFFIFNGLTPSKMVARACATESLN